MTSMNRKWWSKDTVAVVTGANQGIGNEIVRQLAREGLTVVLTARDSARGQAAVDALKAEGLDSVVFHPLEVCSSESVEKLAIWLKHEFGGIDIVVNNAGITSSGMTVNYENAKNIVETNYYGGVRVIEGLFPLLRASQSGSRIVTVTSGAGNYERLQGESLKNQFRDHENYSKEFANSMATKFLEDVKAGRQHEEGWIPANGASMYAESKIFLNTYLVSLAKSLSATQQLGSQQVFVMTFCPGVTRNARLDKYINDSQSQRAGYPIPKSIKTLAEGADTGVWLALLPKDELLDKHGKFFGERKEYSLITLGLRIKHDH